MLNHSLICANLRITPFLSFFWNLGRVENIRHRVDTTTKRQETTAITWEFFFLSFFCAFLKFCCSPWRRRNDADSQTGSTNVSVSWSSSRCQNPPPALLAVTSEKWLDTWQQRRILKIRRSQNLNWHQEKRVVNKIDMGLSKFWLNDFLCCSFD